MKLSLVIDALRDRAPVFQDRVFGAAEFEENVREGAAPVTLPAAYVMPIDEERVSESERHLADVIIVERFAVVLVINQIDQRGEAAVDEVDDLRGVLLQALHNWHAVRDNGPIFFDGGQVIGQDRKRLFYQYDFAQEVRYGPGDGYSAPCDDFGSAAIRVDQHDPDGQIDIGADVVLP